MPLGPISLQWALAAAAKFLDHRSGYKISCDSNYLMAFCHPESFLRSFWKLFFKARIAVLGEVLMSFWVLNASAIISEWLCLLKSVVFSGLFDFLS